MGGGGGAVRQLAGIPKGSLPTRTMELAELLHAAKANRRMLVMGPAQEHRQHLRLRRSNTLSLSTQRAVPCDAGREQGKGWLLLGKAGEAPQGQRRQRRVPVK